jgi:hypothetical protein
MNTGMRVTALYYKVPQQLYKSETYREVDLDGFHGELRPDECNFTPTEHCGSPEDARARLEPQLERWRRWVLLERGENRLPFVYVRADCETWPPSKPGGFVAAGGRAEVTVTGFAPSLAITSEFPDLPPPFKSDDECVEVGLTLLADAMQKPVHVLKFALAYLALLEAEHEPTSGNLRKEVSMCLNIDVDTLSNFGELCTNGGTGAEARTFKRGKRRNRIPVTDDRREWVFQVFRELIKRQGRWAAGAVPVDQYVNRRPDIQAFFGKK